MKGFFYHGFLIIEVEKKLENFKNNMNNQKVKTLVLNVATQSLCAFLTIIENNAFILKYILKQKQMLQVQGRVRVTPFKRLKTIDTQRKQK